MKFQCSSLTSRKQNTIERRVNTQKFMNKNIKTKIAFTIAGSKLNEQRYELRKFDCSVLNQIQ